MSKTVHCNCKSGCKTKRCVCLKNDEACDENCGCINCKNPLNGIIIITDEVKKEVVKIIDRFNKEVLDNSPCNYYPRFKHDHLYIDRGDYGHSPAPICSLKYTGKMDKWKFAIFKYSIMYYDPDEFFFPGIQHVDGTIEGALKAGMEAYNVSHRSISFGTFQ